MKLRHHLQEDGTSPHALLGARPRGELSREQAGRGREPGGLDRKHSINGHTSKQSSALSGGQPFMNRVSAS